jgi:ABC-2 type transport system ATP-binding protein
MGRSMAVIELNRVTKSYGRSRGIVDVDLAIEQGEVFGYLGPNGAGKTTTIRLFLDFIRPTTGTVRVLGRSPREPALRHQIGYLAGELDLYERFTGTELITYFDNLRGNGSLRHALELSERMKLDLSRPIGKLSKGNKQKVGVVQALMHKPQLLVLDEPTSGLDPLVQEEFYALLEEHRGIGGTVFLSSHVLSEVERIAGRVGIIREGRIVEVATLRELRARAVREFEVSFDEDVPVSAFAALPNLTDVRMSGRTLTCRVTGSVDPFIKAVAQYNVANFISQGADLEALFLAYYRGGTNAS